MVPVWSRLTLRSQKMGWEGGGARGVEGFHAELKFCLSILLQASVLSLDLPANQITVSKSVFSCAEREQSTASRRGGAHRGSQMPGRMHGPPTYLQFQAGSGPFCRLTGTQRGNTCLKAVLSVPPAACGKTEFASGVSRPVGRKQQLRRQPPPQSASHWDGGVCCFLGRSLL